MRRSTRKAAIISLAVGAIVAGLTAFTINSPPAFSDIAQNEQCRPDGLYRTPSVDVPYCLAYDTAGREKMGADHPRRIIGYFTSWRTGKDGDPGVPGQQHPVDEGHPRQLRLRSRRRRRTRSRSATPARRTTPPPT